MKLLAILLLVASATAGRLDNTYLPPSNALSSGGASTISITPVNALPSIQVTTPTTTVSSLYGAPAAEASATPVQLTNTYLPPNSANSASQPSNPSVASPNSLPSSQVPAATPPTLSSLYGAPLAVGRITAAVAAPVIPTFTNVAVASPNVLYGAPVVGAQTYSRPATPPVPILRFNSDTSSDGRYSYAYETANHIAAQESGRPKALDSFEVQGSYAYLAPNGQTIALNYVADENGFRAEGAHLPTPPPIPAAILKSLEFNAAEEARGIINDGQYRQVPTGSVVLGQGVAQISNQYLPPTSAQGGYRY